MKANLVAIKDCVVKAKTWNPVVEAKDENITYIDIAAVDKDLKKIVEPTLCLGEEAPSRARQLVQTNDVLVSTVRPNLNSVAVVTEKFSGATASTGYTVLRPLPEILDTQYLFHWVKTDHFINAMIKLATGQSYPAVSDKIILNSKIPLPPLPEQRRIAAILDQADEVRQKRQQAIEKLDQLLQATFIDMFGDPVSNPRGWELVSAKNVLKIQGGYAFSSTDFSKSGIPVVKIGNANKLGFSTEKFDFIIPQYPEKLKQYELRSGDLLMSLTGTVGKDDYGNITEVTDDYELYYLNQRVAKLEVINTLFSKNYIRYFFSQSSIKALITKNNRGVRQANISNSDLYELDIPLPTKAQLDKFDSFIQSINEMKRYSKIQLISSNKLFFALQNQAFNGTL